MDKKYSGYSNQSFDTITNMAYNLADAARLSGRKDPQYGYSKEDWKKAEAEYYCRPTIDVL